MTITTTIWKAESKMHFLLLMLRFREEIPTFTGLFGGTWPTETPDEDPTGFCFALFPEQNFIVHTSYGAHNPTDNFNLLQSHNFTQL